MNSDTCFASIILMNLYREYSLHWHHPIWGISTILLNEKIDKDDHKNVSNSSWSLSSADQWHSQSKWEFF